MTITKLLEIVLFFLYINNIDMINKLFLIVQGF